MPIGVKRLVFSGFGVAAAENRSCVSVRKRYDFAPGWPEK